MTGFASSKNLIPLPCNLILKTHLIRAGPESMLHHLYSAPSPFEHVLCWCLKERMNEQIKHDLIFEQMCLDWKVGKRDFSNLKRHY